MDSLQGCIDTQLQRLTHDNEHLQRENELLQAYLDQAEQMGLTTALDGTIKKKKTRKGRDVADVPDVVPSLTDEEKNDLVNQALEGLTADIAQIKAAGDKDLADVATLLEEVELRIVDIKKATWEFRRDVIIGGEDVRSAKTAAEKVVKFLEDHIHTKQVLIEKLTLKNATYKAAVTKLEAQLAHKEEMGEVLHLVDFDQLKIENQQYMERIAAKNQELLQLKLSAGKAVQLLNDVKSRLSKLMAEGTGLRTQLTGRKTELGSISGQCNAAARQSQAATATLVAMQTTQKNVDQPQIIDYVKLKGQVTTLQTAVSDLRRKVEVVQGAAATRSMHGSALSSKRAVGTASSGLRASQPATSR